ncbi:MAG: TraB family protein, partial [Candidatus Marinimicrobia bacterium CG_4_10_14_0_2_um_filter_48_9]
MKEAILIASSMNIPIALVDRNVKITLKRAMSKMSLIEKAKLLYAVIGGMFGFSGEKIDRQKIEEMKKKDVVSELINELSRQMPSVKEVLVDERDHYIANKIININAKKIVCVLGAGHLEGIKNILTGHSKINYDISSLEKTPKSP